MKINEDLPIKKLMGNKIIVRRYKYPEKKESGIILPTNYINTKDDVSKKVELPKFQNRGEVIAIGTNVEEGLVELGDVVHFQPNYYQMALFDKEDLGMMMDRSPYIDNAEVIIDALNGIDWVEKVETATAG